MGNQKNSAKKQGPRKPRELAAESYIRQLLLNFIRIQLKLHNDIVKKMKTIVLLQLCIGNEIRFNKKSYQLKEPCISQELFEYFSDLVNKDEKLISVAPKRNPKKKNAGDVLNEQLESESEQAEGELDPSSETDGEEEN